MNREEIKKIREIQTQNITRNLSDNEEQDYLDYMFEKVGDLEFEKVAKIVDKIAKNGHIANMRMVRHIYFQTLGDFLRRANNEEIAEFLSVTFNKPYDKMLAFVNERYMGD